MINKIQERIPDRKPDIQIASLLIWVIGYSADNQKSLGDFSYFSTPIFLSTENVIIFSEGSAIALFNFKSFFDQLVAMEENVGIHKTAQLHSDNSELSVQLESNDEGQITVFLTYYAWHLNGKLSFEEKIDQSYLPAIILSVRRIVEKLSNKEF